MSQDPLDDARAFLRACTTADIRFDEHFRPLKYIISPIDGQLVMPVMVAMLQTMDTVLFAPDVREDALEIQVTLEPFDEHGPDGALADRWRIHHGRPEDVNWAFASIDAVKFRGHVIDGDALMDENPLRRDEAALCREMNDDHGDDLRRLCRHVAGIGVEEPVMVAIDPGGLHVRGTFDVIRVEAAEPMPTGADARRVLADMMAAARN